MSEKDVFEAVHGRPQEKRERFGAREVFITAISNAHLNGMGPIAYSGSGPTQYLLLHKAPKDGAFATAALVKAGSEFEQLPERIRQDELAALVWAKQHQARLVRGILASEYVL